MTVRIRRWKWSGLGATVVAAVTSLALAAPATGAPTAPTPWEQYRGGPARTGFQPYEATLTPSTVSRLGIAWQKPLGYMYSSSPAVVGDMVYVGASTSLYALAAGNGAVRWSQQLIGDAYDNSPAVVGGTAYITSATFDYEPAYAWAFDAATGARKWRTAFPTDRQHFTTSPAVAGGLVYFVLTSYCASTPCTPNTVFALDAATGARRWSARVGTGISEIAVRSGLLYYGDVEGDVVALDARTGAPRWRSTLNTATEINEVGSPAVANGLVYVGVNSYSATSDTGRVLCALDANTGALRWCLSARSHGGAIPTVGNGLVYAVAEGQLYAVDAVTGVVKRWRRGIAGIKAPLALAAGVLYAGVTPVRGQRQVYALNAATGETLKTVPLGSQGEIHSSPAIYRGSVYVGDTAGYLTALRLQ